MNYILLIILTISFIFTSCKTNNVHLASDARTGRYIGVVQNEVRDFETKEIIYYEIGNGEELIRKTPQEINIYEP